MRKSGIACFLWILSISSVNGQPTKAYNERVIEFDLNIWENFVKRSNELRKVKGKLTYDIDPDKDRPTLKYSISFCDYSEKKYNFLYLAIANISIKMDELKLPINRTSTRESSSLISFNSEIPFVQKKQSRLKTKKLDTEIFYKRVNNSYFEMTNFTMFDLTFTHDHKTFEIKLSKDNFVDEIPLTDSGLLGDLSLLRQLTVVVGYLLWIACPMLQARKGEGLSHQSFFRKVNFFREKRIMLRTFSVYSDLARFIIYFSLASDLGEQGMPIFLISGIVCPNRVFIVYRLLNSVLKLERRLRWTCKETLAVLLNVTWILVFYIFDDLWIMVNFGFALKFVCESLDFLWVYGMKRVSFWTSLNAMFLVAADLVLYDGLYFLIVYYYGFYVFAESPRTVYLLLIILMTYSVFVSMILLRHFLTVFLSFPDRPKSSIQDVKDIALRRKRAVQLFDVQSSQCRNLNSQKAYHVFYNSYLIQENSVIFSNREEIVKYTPLKKGFKKQWTFRTDQHYGFSRFVINGKGQKIPLYQTIITKTRVKIIHFRNRKILIQFRALNLVNYLSTIDLMQPSDAKFIVDVQIHQNTEIHIHCFSKTRYKAFCFRNRKVSLKKQKDLLQTNGQEFNDYPEQYQHPSDFVKPCYYQNRVALVYGVVRPKTDKQQIKEGDKVNQEIIVFDNKLSGGYFFIYPLGRILTILRFAFKNLNILDLCFLDLETLMLVFRDRIGLIGVKEGNLKRVVMLRDSFQRKSRICSSFDFKRGKLNFGEFAREKGKFWFRSGFVGVGILKRVGFINLEEMFKNREREPEVEEKPTKKRKDFNDFQEKMSLVS
jgi:hypothetical protein